MSRPELRYVFLKGLAPRHGFEPRLTAPKAAVLPLDDRGIEQLRRLAELQFSKRDGPLTISPVRVRSAVQPCLVRPAVHVEDARSAGAASHRRILHRDLPALIRTGHRVLRNLAQI